MKKGEAVRSHVSCYREVYLISRSERKRYNKPAPPHPWKRIRKIKMTRPLKPLKEFYTEVEAANELNISIHELHSLLDEYIFNDGSPRPEELSFCEADLVLLGFWSKSKENPKVIRMPRRREA
jgi:hypothetical protein